MPYEIVSLEKAWSTSARAAAAAARRSKTASKPTGTHISQRRPGTVMATPRQKALGKLAAKRRDIQGRLLFHLKKLKTAGRAATSDETFAKIKGHRENLRRIHDMMRRL
jgi:hypothetical protein